MTTLKQLYDDCVSDRVCTTCENSVFEPCEYPCRDCVGTLDHPNYKAIIPDEMINGLLITLPDHMMDVLKQIAEANAGTGWTLEENARRILCESLRQWRDRTP